MPNSVVFSFFLSELTHHHQQLDVNVMICSDTRWQDEDKQPQLQTYGCLAIAHSAATVAVQVSSTLHMLASSICVHSLSCNASMSTAGWCTPSSL